MSEDSVAFIAYNQAIEDAKAAILAEANGNSLMLPGTFINAIARKCSPHVYVNRLSAATAAPVEQSEHIEAIDCYAPYKTSSSTSARAAAEQIDEATMEWALRELADGWIQNNEREGPHGFYQNARRVLNAIVNRT